MSIQTKVYNQKSEETGKHELSDKVFGVKANIGLIHQAVVAQMGNQRQVLAHTKGKSEVRGGGKKPWKQKGTGRARAGSSRSPIWIGGGITFGPRSDQNFSKRINKKMRQKALVSVLSNKVKNESFVILDKFEIKEYKTKKFNDIISKLEKKVFVQKIKSNKQEKEEVKDDKKDKVVKNKAKNQKRSILIIDSEKNEKLKKSANNLPGIQIINLENINIVDLLKYKNLIINLDSIKKIEKQYK